MIHIVNNTQTVITVNNSINDNSDCIDIIDFIKALSAYEHLSVNTVNALDSSINFCFTDCFMNTCCYFFFYLIKEFLSLCALYFKFFTYIIVSNGIKETD